MTMKKCICVAVLLLVTALQGGAVLKEGSMEQTLSVLCEELTQTHQEQKERAARFEQRNKQFQKSIAKDLELCNNIELMLYSQKDQNVFDLAYACGQATSLYDRLSRTRSFKQFEQQQDEQIAQYENLVRALYNIPDRQLTTPQMRATRDSCINLAKVIESDIRKARATLKDNHEQRQFVADKAKKLNDHALAMYERIRQSVFINGGQSYFKILSRFDYNWKSSKDDFSEKYLPARKTRSEWRGGIIGFLFIFMAIYILGALLLSWLIMRFAVPKRFITLSFRKKRSCIVVCAAAAVFGIATLIISNVLTDQNFMIMATKLLSEYAWLIAVIMLSIIIRLDGNAVKSGAKLYVPVLVIGFVVFFFRIVFLPNTIVNLVFPILLLGCTIWQLVANRRHSSDVPRSDVFYSWISFIVMAVSCVMSWMGYTLMSVQVLIWWIMLLTMIQTITVIYDLLHSYENKYIPADADVRRTWFYDAVYKMIIPIAATLSVALSIYWAAQVFDLTQWCERIFRYKFVDQPGLIVLSLDRLLFCVALAFVFHYIIYLFIQGYQLWKQNRAESRAISLYERENDVADDEEIDIETVIQDDPNAKAKVKAASKAVTLSMNIIKYIGWGIYIYFVLVTLQVSRTGITFILTGLSTGIGFAMKDTLENLFYGLSLMNGRVKIGDVIECDGVRGKVSNINYQSTLVETVDGSVIAFLNSQLFTKNFKNMTRNHGYEMAKITVGVAYGSKIDAVREMIIERISHLDCYDPKKGVQVLFQNFGESSVDLLVVVWVRVASQVADIARIKENIYSVLNEHGIEIPFPQSDIHIRTAITKP